VTEKDKTQTIGLAAEIGSASKIFGGAIKLVDASSTLLIKTTFLDLDPATPDGVIIRAVTPPWLQIVREIHRNPSFLFEFVNEPHKFEDFIAAAYRADGWDKVIITPRSGDLGRDVIASRQDPTPIRLLDQCKALSSGRVVEANDVRALFGVLSKDLNASKAVVTTTSTFAPGIEKEFEDEYPYRLDLRDGPKLTEWLRSIAGEK